MINIEKAQKVITENVTCQVRTEENIDRSGAYLEFQKPEVLNKFNIDYYFILYVSAASFNNDLTKAYEPLNKALNEINEAGDFDDPLIELVDCKALKRDKNLMTYALRLKVNILG